MARPRRPTEEHRLPGGPGPRLLSAQTEALTRRTLKTQAAANHHNLAQEVI